MIEQERSCFQREFAETDVSLRFSDTLADSAAWQRPRELIADTDGVIFAGSGEFDLDGGRDPEDVQQQTAHKLSERIAWLMDHCFHWDVPTLGVCFGHQLMGKFNGAEVVHDPDQAKVGSYPVAQNGVTHYALQHAPREFMAQYGHKDSLTSIPAGAEVAAYGRACSYSALRYSDRIISVQFHPELNARDMEDRLSNSPGYLPEGTDANEVVRESPHANSVLAAFGQVVASSR